MEHDQASVIDEAASRLEAVRKVRSREADDAHVAALEIVCAYVRENAHACDAEDFAMPIETSDEERQSVEWWQDEYKPALNEWLQGLKPPEQNIQWALAVASLQDVERFPYKLYGLPGLSTLEDKDEMDRIEKKLGRIVSRSLSFHLDLKGTNLRLADVSGCDFRHANFEDARLEGASFANGILDGAIFCEAHLEGACFAGAHISYTGFQYAWLEGANFKNVRGTPLLRGARLNGADLSNACLQSTDAAEAHFDGASLVGANLEGAYLEVSRMRDADLSGANLKSANFDIVSSPCLNVSFADFTGATRLHRQHVGEFFGCAGTTLPNYATSWRPQHWYPGKLRSDAERKEAWRTWKRARAAGERPPWVAEENWTGW